MSTHFWVAAALTLFNPLENNILVVKTNHSRAAINGTCKLLVNNNENIQSFRTFLRER